MGQLNKLDSDYGKASPEVFFCQNLAQILQKHINNHPKFGGEMAKKSVSGDDSDQQDCCEQLRTATCVKSMDDQLTLKHLTLKHLTLKHLGVNQSQTVQIS